MLKFAETHSISLPEPLNVSPPPSYAAILKLHTPYVQYLGLRRDENCQLKR